MLWEQLEVCDTRGSRWKYVGVYGSSWKLPRNAFVQAAIDGNNVKLPLPPTVEACMYFYGSFH